MASAMASDKEIRQLLFWHRPGCPKPGEQCIAQFNFEAQRDGELSFRKGNPVKLLKPSGQSPYWWRAEDNDGKQGLVPVNFLRLEDDDPIVADYEEMLAKVYQPGTQVQARANSAPKSASELVFRRGDLMYIVNQVDERSGWYKARLVSRDGKACEFKEGLVHSNLLESVYEVYQSRTGRGAGGSAAEQLTTDPVYETFEEFQAYSMWFDGRDCQTGSLEALYRRLAQMARMTFEGFMDVQEAVYTVQQTISEQYYVGAASILHKELAAHFLSWDKPDKQKTHFDKELFDVPSCYDWRLNVIPLEEEMNLNVERAKLIVSKDSLQPNGLNEEMTFTTQEEWEEFEKWFFP
eukprot:m.310431 g.310431  ORF g.310431 m.310431 type:complete len:350 (+) comp51612_c0_seq1:177-1226(+)